MSAFRVEDLPIESGMLTSSLDEAQRKVETYFFDIRKQLFDYDQVREGGGPFFIATFLPSPLLPNLLPPPPSPNSPLQVLNQQREKVYGDRRRVLMSPSLRPYLIEAAEKTVGDILDRGARFFHRDYGHTLYTADFFFNSNRVFLCTAVGALYR